MRKGLDYRTNRLTTAGLAALVLGSAFSATACRSGADRTSLAISTLTILHPGDEAIFGPDWPAKFLVFLPLVEINSAGEVEGRLAERWEHTSDYREWTIHLRQGITWQDDVPVTAHDVKFTLDLLSHPEVGYLPPGSFSATVLDDSTYKITYLGKGGGSPLEDLWTAYYPKHLLEGRDLDRFFSWDFWYEPVGNGPYRFVNYLPKTAVELEANSDFYFGEPEIDRVVLKIGHAYGEETSLVEIVSGNVDAIPYVDPMALLKVENDSRFRVYYGIDVDHFTAIAWNQRHKPFADPRIRRALTLAIDRHAVLRALNLPDDVPISDVFLTTDQFRQGRIPPSAPYDTVQARQLLEEAGLVRCRRRRDPRQGGRKLHVRRNRPGMAASASRGGVRPRAAA